MLHEVVMLLRATAVVVRFVVLVAVCSAAGALLFAAMPDYFHWGIQARAALYFAGAFIVAVSIVRMLMDD